MLYISYLGVDHSPDAVQVLLDDGLGPLGLFELGDDVLETVLDGEEVVVERETVRVGPALLLHSLGSIINNLCRLYTLSSLRTKPPSS